MHLVAAVVVGCVYVYVCLCLSLFQEYIGYISYVLLHMSLLCLHALYEIETTLFAIVILFVKLQADGFVAHISILKNKLFFLRYFPFSFKQMHTKVISTHFFWMQIWQLKSKRHQINNKKGAVIASRKANVYDFGGFCFCRFQLKSIPH